MSIDEVARHIKRDDKVVVNVPAFDRLHIGLWNYGDCKVIDLGTSSMVKSQLYSFGFSNSKSETLGRVYLPMHYTPKMTASFFDSLFQCAIESRDQFTARGATKLEKMLEAGVPQDKPVLDIERLSDLSYVDGYDCHINKTTSGGRIAWHVWDDRDTIFDITPTDGYYMTVRVGIHEPGVFDVNRHVWKLDYPYEMDDVVAYTMFVRTILAQYKREQITA